MKGVEFIITDISCFRNGGIKMRFGFFAGLILILIGLSMILPIGLPIFRIVIAIAFLVFGIKILIGNNHNFNNHRDRGGFRREFGENNSIFQKRKININNKQSEYNIIFGAGEIDLTELKLGEYRGLDINVVFSDGRILINDDIPVKLEITSILSSVQLADGEVSVIGRRIIKTSAYDDSDERVKIRVNAVFASLRVFEK